MPKPGWRERKQHEETTGERTCLGCGLAKPLGPENFSRNKDGFSHQCKACRRAYDVGYGVKNSARRIASATAWQKANPERNREIQKRSRQRRYWADPEAARARQRARFHENRELFYASSNRYRQRRAEAGPDLSPDERQLLLQVFGGRCLSCGGKDRVVLDHVLPLSKGGLNGIGNRQPLCHSCNSTKSDKDTDFRDPQLAALLMETV